MSDSEVSVLRSWGERVYRKRGFRIIQVGADGSRAIRQTTEHMLGDHGELERMAGIAVKSLRRRERK